MEKFTFKGFATSNEDDLFQISVNNEKYYNNKKVFSDAIKDIEKISSKPEKIKAIENFIHQNMNELNLMGNECMTVFRLLLNNKAFNQAIDFYSKCQNEDFKSSLMVKELLMVGLNKNNQPERTIALGERLIKENQVSGDVYGALGKAYYQMYQDQSKTSEERSAYLLKSAQTYEKGFADFAEFYPGINAAYKYIEYGDIDKATKIAEIVYLACQKEGANETNDYWCTTTLLESSCILNKPREEIIHNLNRLLSYEMPEWAWETTKNTLENVGKFVSQETSDSIKLVISKLDQKLTNSNFEVDSNTKTFENQNEEKINCIINNSYNYRGLASNFEGSSSVSGNINFGGQLPPHTISRADIEIFDSIINSPMTSIFPNEDMPEEFKGYESLAKIDDIETFLKLTDKFIRYHFSTENFAQTGLHLEHNAEINNSIYDQTVSSMFSLAGIEGNKNADARTNITSMFSAGMGDCRHHAQVKQLLFDRWQGNKMKSLLIDCYQNQLTGDTALYNKNLNQFNKLLNTQLRTIDVEVNLPIKINGKYDAVKSPDGKFINQDEYSLLEDHTMTLLLDTNSSEPIIKVVDAFYQNNYDWANRTVDIDDVTIDKNGDFFMPMGELSGDKSANGKQIPIKIKSICYAGKRDKSNIDELGNIMLFFGIPININKQIFFNVLKNRKKMCEKLNGIRTWNAKNKLIVEEMNMENKENKIQKSPEEMTKHLFNYVISKIKSGEIKPVVCAKNTCVDAHIVTPEEVGKEHIVWSHGKVEKTITLKEGMVLLKTLDENGKPIIDKSGHENVYDMTLQKFQKTYTTMVNGHYVKDPYAKGSVMIAVKLDDKIINDGITLLPPGWGGYEGTLVKGGILMFPFDPERSLEGQIWAWQQEGYNNLDWYPNNEADTYSPCDKNGTFENKSLRATFNQTKEYQGSPYTKSKEANV